MQVGGASPRVERVPVVAVLEGLPGLLAQEECCGGGGRQGAASGPGVAHPRSGGDVCPLGYRGRVCKAQGGPGGPCRPLLLPILAASPPPDSPRRRPQKQPGEGGRRQPESTSVVTRAGGARTRPWRAWRATQHAVPAGTRPWVRGERSDDLGGEPLALAWMPDATGDPARAPFPQGRLPGGRPALLPGARGSGLGAILGHSPPIPPSCGHPGWAPGPGLGVPPWLSGPQETTQTETYRPCASREGSRGGCGVQRSSAARTGDAAEEALEGRGGGGQRGKGSQHAACGEGAPAGGDPSAARGRGGDARDGG